MMNSDEKVERFMTFTIADCVELVSLVGYVKFMEVLYTALLTKKNSLALSQDELDAKKKHLWNDWMALSQEELDAKQKHLWNDWKY